MNKQLLISTAVVALIIGGVFLAGVKMVVNQSPQTPLDAVAEDANLPEVANTPANAPEPLVASDVGDYDRKKYDDDEYEEEDEYEDDDDDYRAPAVPTPAVQTPSGDSVGTSPLGGATPTPVPTTSTQSGYTLADVATHNSAASCWMIIRGKVYDVTKYISKHPGGNNILKGCGKDATSLFEGVSGHLKQATLNILPGYYKGDLI